jgi:hypothetical protein
VGFLCYKFFAGRKMFLFIIILAINLTFDLGVVLYLAIKEPKVDIVIILISMEGILSSLLCYIGTFILPFDIGKIILLKQNRKLFGSIFGLITAFKYVVDGVII